MREQIQETSWAFASGRAAVLESRMLPDEFFERLIGMEGKEDVVHALGETRAAEQFRTVEDLREAGVRVRQVYGGIIGKMRALSPDAAVVGLLDVEKEFRSLKSHLKREVLGLNVSPVECRFAQEQWSRLWQDLPTDLPPWFDAARRRVLRADGWDRDSSVLDAAMDDATLTALVEAAEATGNEFVAGYFRRYDTVKGVEMYWRATVLGAQEAILKLCATGRRDAELFAAMAALPEEDWPRLIGAWLDGIKQDDLDAPEPEQRVAQFVREAADWLMAYVRRAKYVPFGAERVFGCVIGLDAECYNLALVLAGRGNDVAPDVLRRLLRACYPEQ